MASTEKSPWLLPTLTLSFIDFLIHGHPPSKPWWSDWRRDGYRKTGAHNSWTTNENSTASNQVRRYLPALLLRPHRAHHSVAVQGKDSPKHRASCRADPQWGPVDAIEPLHCAKWPLSLAAKQSLALSGPIDFPSTINEHGKEAYSRFCEGQTSSPHQNLIWPRSHCHYCFQHWPYLALRSAKCRCPE